MAAIYDRSRRAYYADGRLRSAEATWCLGVEEAATAANVDPPTIERWVSDGRWPPPDALLAMGPVWRAESVGAALRALNTEN